MARMNFVSGLRSYVLNDMANGMRAVTVVANSCLEAGIYSTAVFVLGLHEGLHLASLARGEKHFALWPALLALPVAAGRARIVVGARSALFLPFRKLRLIIVDEEHDQSYKQEEGFIYQARDLAVARAKIEAALVVLASATPSLETLWNAHHGRYGWLKLSARHGTARRAASALGLRHRPQGDHREGASAGRRAPARG